MTTNPFDQPQPHSIPAEMALLGCLILNPANIPEARLKLAPSDFYHAAHTAVYTALVDAFDWTGGADADLVLVEDRLRREGKLDGVGGGEYLIRLAESVPTGVNWPHYLRIVREHAQSRTLIEAAGTAMHSAVHDGNPAEVATALESRLHAVRAGREERGEFTGEEAFDLALADLRAGQSGFYTTGIGALDERCGGVPMMGVTTIVGASGSGKSSLAGAFLRHFIFDLNLGVGVFSTEVPAKRYMANIVQQGSGVPISRIERRGKPLDAVNDVELSGWSDRLAGRSVLLCQDALGPAEIFSRCGSWKRRGVQVVVIDYIQNLPRNGMDEYELVNEAMGCCRRLVNELGLTVIALSQPIVSAARSAEPLRMSDCRGSSAIEEVTDMGLSVWRGCTGRTQTRDESDEDWDAARRNMEIHIVKNKRLGMVGMVKADFDIATTRIVA